LVGVVELCCFWSSKGRAPFVGLRQVIHLVSKLGEDIANQPIELVGIVILSLILPTLALLQFNCRFAVLLYLRILFIESPLSQSSPPLEHWGGGKGRSCSSSTPVGSCWSTLKGKSSPFVATPEGEWEMGETEVEAKEPPLERPSVVVDGVVL